MKKILFISHDASRSGAPLVLLNLIKWIKSNHTNIEIDVLTLKAGPLENAFKKNCSNFFVYEAKNKPEKFKNLLLNKIKTKIRIKNVRTSKEALFYKNIVNNNYNLIYANTIVTVPIAVQLKSLIPNVKLLVHIHELNAIIKTFVPNFSNYVSNLDFIIAASSQVKRNLIKNWNVTESIIEIIYPFAVTTVPKIINQSKNKSFRIGASGLAYWRKGDDIFLQVASLVKKKLPQVAIEFIWVGANNIDKIMLEEDIQKLQLSKTVNFIGEQKNPFDLYNSFDVFLLTSREDPFPLVCIEVAQLEKPIICFDKASGSSEIIKNGGGFVVPYLDIEEMANKVIYYYNNQHKLKEHGKKNKKLFAPYTSAKICPQIYNQILKII